jgi:KDO2-lipid IV(A) lauroyltransferase
MSSSLVVWLFNLAARLPLSWLHRLGVLVGWLTYLTSAKYAARMRENMGYALKHLSATELRKVLHDSIGETGKSVAEVPWVWCRPVAEVVATVQACHGWEHVEEARSKGQGVVFLTPHLGCFEVSALYAAVRVPITVLYRPPKLVWLAEIMRVGRERGQLRLARTDVGGVRLLYKALKRGEAIGLLPDQVPGNGEGEWADFFGHPAYTMTLVGRLVESSGAKMLMACAERLPAGAGYIIRITPLEFSTAFPVTGQMNKALEAEVSTCPAQYLWSYNRYKVPAGVAPFAGQNGLKVGEHQ